MAGRSRTGGGLVSVPTGVKRLDDLLGGGVPKGSTTLLRGPPFTGRTVLGRLFVLAGVRAGEPGVLVLTDASASEASEALAAVDPKVPDYEADGLLWYVDAYTEGLGGEVDHPRGRAVPSAVDLNAFTRVMNEVQRELLADHDAHRMLFDSVTTMIVNANAQTAFRFLQVFLGRTRQAGGTSMLLLDDGIHADDEVQLVTHLVDGLVQTVKEDERTALRVEGLGLNKSPGWVEYEFDDDAFEITGSFGVGRIR